MRLEIAGGKTRFKPGESLEGTLFWDFAVVPKGMEVKLCWQTQGKGTQDREVVKRLHWECSTRSDRKAFTIPLPEGPYSFSGKLVSLVWSLEAAADLAAGKAEPVNFTLSPDGNELLLHRK